MERYRLISTMDNLSDLFSSLSLSKEDSTVPFVVASLIVASLIDGVQSTSDEKQDETPKKKQEEQKTMNTDAPIAVKRRRPVLIRTAATAAVAAATAAAVAATATTEVTATATVTVPLTVVDRLHALFESHSDPRIRLLRRRDVLQWLFGDFSFLPPIERKNKTQDILALKPLEDVWGQGVVREIRPDLRLDKQWTNLFGEYLCQEIQVALGKNPFIPVTKEGFHPDVETEDQMVEAKAGTYFTTGTAHEKIAGVFFKYADVPVLYGKPLVVVCLGGAERLARDQYGLLAGQKCTPQKQRILEFHRANGVEVVGATELLRRMME